MKHGENQCNLARKKSNQSGHAGPLCSWSKPCALGARVVILAHPCSFYHTPCFLFSAAPFLLPG